MAVTRRMGVETGKNRRLLVEGRDADGRHPVLSTRVRQNARDRQELRLAINEMASQCQETEIEPPWLPTHEGS